MKALLLAATSLLATACTHMLPLPPEPPAAWPSQYVRYEPLPRARHEQLQHALRHCATVELQETRFCRFQTLHRLKRGAELEAILTQLAEVPWWYWVTRAADAPVMDIRLCEHRLDRIRFLGAEGEVLYEHRELFSPLCGAGKKGELVFFCEAFRAVCPR